MKEYDQYYFYEYDKLNDKLNIYGDDISSYFEKIYNIIIDSIDFDENQNVILYIEDINNKELESIIEKSLITNFQHLNDVEIKKTKIILTFDCKEIELF